MLRSCSFSFLAAVVDDAGVRVVDGLDSLKVVVEVVVSVRQCT